MIYSIFVFMRIGGKHIFISSTNIIKNLHRPLPPPLLLQVPKMNWVLKSETNFLRQKLKIFEVKILLTNQISGRKNQI